MQELKKIEQKIEKIESESQEPEAFIEKIVHINRCTKVTKGGKNLHFSALVIVGNGKGKVGFGLGKANEVADAIRKGIKLAKKNLIEVPLKESRTIPHEVKVKFRATEVLLKPASRGTGVIACSVIRAICECCGIKDILTKILRKSSNPINVTYCVFKAFSYLKPVKT